VNSRKKMAAISCHLFFLTLTLLPGVFKSQNISNYYTSSDQVKGRLYFIFPQRGFHNHQIHSRLIYDITCLTTNDSSTFNFSYFDKLNRDIDSVFFISGTKRYASVAKKIFIATKKKKWHYRYSAKILFRDLSEIFSAEQQPRMVIYTKQAAIEMTMKARVWKKRSAVTKKIFTLISYNR
jgi:hypothetical protein